MRTPRPFRHPCAYCAKEFAGETRQARAPKYCSAVCLAAGQSAANTGKLSRKNDQCGSANPYWKGGALLHLCEICGTSFRTKHNPRKPRRFCGMACIAKHRTRIYLGTNNPSHKASPPDIKKCRKCGVEFMATGPTRSRIYCGLACYFKMTRMSITQERLERELESLGLTVESEKRWPWLVNPATGGNLRVDMYLPEFNLAVEYDGEMHVKGITEDELIKTKQRDRAKDALLKSKGIPLLRITPYRTKAANVAAAIKELAEHCRP